VIKTNEVGAGLAKSLEYPTINLKSKPALSQASVAKIWLSLIKAHINLGRKPLFKLSKDITLEGQD